MIDTSPAPGDYCICLDDPWTAVRSLKFDGVARNRQRVIEGPYFMGTSVPLEPVGGRLCVNPYKTAHDRIKAARSPSPKEALRERKALQVRVATASLGREMSSRLLSKLQSELACLFTGLSPEFIEGCLKSMVASKALIISQKTGKPTAKLKFEISDDMKRADQLCAFAFSFADELINQSRRIGNLISHRGTAGGYREELLRNLLRKTLPERYHVATGFINGCDLQLDLIVYDRIDYAPLFREGDLVVVPHDAVRAVIEVKTNLSTAELRSALEHLDGLPLQVGKPIFKGIFAFETEIADTQLANHVASFYGGEVFWGGPCGNLCADDAPKAGCVVDFDKVGELMHDHIVYYEHRRLDETPVESDVVVNRAGAPAVAVINDLGRCGLDAKFTCVPFHASEDLFFRPRFVPIS